MLTLPYARLARLGLVLLAPVTMIAALAVTAEPAAANPAGPHDPIGKLEKVTANPDGSLDMLGWAADPDTTAHARLVGLVDGRKVASAVTSLPRPSVRKQYHTGAGPGFEFSVPVPISGVHTACVAVTNVGAGIARVLRCVATPLGTKLSAAVLQTHNPLGVMSSVRAGTASMRVTGWAVEPDYLGGRLTAVLYVDGQSVSTVITHRATAAQHKAGAGTYGAFDITVPVSSGAHLGCIWLVNAGLGANTSPGCTAVDTRGKTGSGAVKIQAVNTKVVKEANRHLGQPYVWGAAGPKKFDCSGLVLYSYHKAGVTTPRIAADQFAAARLIPATRAVLGDLVFYHDSVGSVYHVGIYLAPLQTVAAVDPQEGVTHQTVWDPSSTTYGSFTHT